MRRVRAFTLFETVTVMAVVAIGGAVAYQLASEQLLQAKGRSDAQGMRLRIREEFRAARERLMPVILTVESTTNGQELVFSDAHINADGTCTALPKGFAARVRFEHATLVSPPPPPPPSPPPTLGAAGGGGLGAPEPVTLDPSLRAPAPSLCQDERGIPVGSSTLLIAWDGGVLSLGGDGVGGGVAGGDGTVSDPFGLSKGLGGP
jgi:hypothetical protein